MSGQLNKLDVVKHKETGEIGVLRKTFKESEEYDTDSSNESDYEEYEDELENGKYLIEWVNSGEFGGEELEDLELIDRPFCCGDVVKLRAKPQGQSGYIETVLISADIRLGNGEQIIKNVPTTELTRLYGISTSSHVQMGDWIGATEEVVQKVKIKFSKTGDEFWISGDYLETLVENDKCLYNFEGLFFPGVRVRIFGEYFGHLCTPLPPGSKRKFGPEGPKKNINPQTVGTEATVIDIDLDYIHVNWKFCRSEGQEPRARVRLNQVNILTTPIDHTLWSLGDVCLVSDEVKNKYEVISSSKKLSKKAKKRANFLKSLPLVNNIGVITSCTSLCRVVWQNGKYTYSTKVQNENENNSNDNILNDDKAELIKSTDLMESQAEDFDFFPNDYVIRKDRNYSSVLGNDENQNDNLSTESNNGSINRSETIVGVVMSVDVNNEVCTVVWRDLANNYRLLGEEKNIPIYHLACFDDFADISLGAQVIKLPSTDSSKYSTSPSSPDALSNNVIDSTLEKIEIKNEEISIEEKNEKESEEAWFGEILESKDNGYLLVHWTDNSTSLEQPNHIIVYLSDSDDEDDSEEYLDDQSVDEQSAIDQSSNPVINLVDKLIKEKKSWEVESHSLLPSDHSDNILSSKLNNNNNNNNNNNDNNNDNDNNKNQNNEIIIIKEREEDVWKILESKANFEVLEKVNENHHFFSKPCTSSNPKLSALLFKEIKILQSHIPKQIFCRTYEDRMDLYQFIIIGSPNTPYYDGIFEFDMYVPAEYPNIPPLVHFRSFLNDKLNPNLYVDGSICLSLLGSWHGEGVELWNPSKSNLLQVMLSIQGLILGSGEPYFLEAGYDKYRNTPSGIEKSARYNQFALSATFRHIHYSLTSLLVPVNNSKSLSIFSEILRAYYQIRLPSIVLRIENFLANNPPISGAEIEAMITRNFDEKNTFGIILFNSIAFHQMLKENLSKLSPLLVFFQDLVEDNK